VTEEICARAERRPGAGWWVAFLASGGLFMGGVAAILYQVCVGIGAWGLNRTVNWGFDIINFVYWVGIGHAGSLISALLFLLRARWRTSIARAAEAMTVFAMICAGVIPLIHLGRPWYALWLAPLPNDRGPMWVNFRSPLLWDSIAIMTYFLVSLTFWYVGLVPDLATLRDRAAVGLRRQLLGFFALGWNGSARAWHHYEALYGLLAILATSLVVAVSSIVASDFATSVIPGWHATIFPPYFVCGAVFCGFAMVLGLLLVVRRVMRLEDYITPLHINWMGKILLLAGLVMSFAYAIEFFVAWYSDNAEELAIYVERATGRYAWAYWTMIFCNVLAPQALWFRKARRSIPLILAICVLVNVGMWLERFLIIVPPLGHDFLPSSWAGYVPTLNEVATFAGMFGLFFALILLFARTLPVVSIAEIKAVAAEGHGELASWRVGEEAGRANSPTRQLAIPVSSLLEEANTLAMRTHRRRPQPWWRRAAQGFHAAWNRRHGTRPRQSLGFFTTASELEEAAAVARVDGYRVLDAFAPYPLHRLGRQLGLRRSPVPWIGFWAGAAALAAGLALQIVPSVYNWPLRVGGQPINALPVWIPVAAVLAILAAGLAGVAGLLYFARLWPGRKAHPLPGVTDDRFALLIAEPDGSIDPEQLGRRLRAWGATAVLEGEGLA
jgi:molybdopterin-containing oxidoreductase family membrane subunit